MTTQINASKTKPSYKVKCSCGKTTVLYWDSVAYRPENKKWRLRIDGHSGWYCGKDGHFSAPGVPKKLET